MCSLIRSQKQVEKPPQSTKVLSTGLHKLRSRVQQKRNALSVTFVDENDTNSKQELVESKPRRGLFQILKDLMKFVGNLLLNSRFCIDELLNIARPVVYVYSVLKFGRKSFRPLKISLLLDLTQIFFSVLRLWRSNREKRRLDELDRQSAHSRPKNQPLLHMATYAAQNAEIEVTLSNQVEDSKLHFLLRNIEVGEITRRCYTTLLKYLVRDPIFSVYTKPIVVAILRKVRVPQTVIAYLFAYVNYYRYFTYIS